MLCVACGVQGASTLGLSLPDYLTQLRHAGLGSLPGTAAEVLHPDVRGHLCPDKISHSQWMQVKGGEERGRGEGRKRSVCVWGGDGGHMYSSALWL